MSESCIPGTPDHPVVKELSEQWHKIAAVIMHVAGLQHVHITPETLDAFERLAPEDMPAVLLHAKNDGLHVRLMSLRQAMAYRSLHETGELDGSQKL